jgi:hypothetical protein
MSNDEQATHHRMAKLYFKFDSGQMAKDMAGRVRSQSSMCNIIDQAHFQGPEHVEACQLVLIQRSAPKAKLIATCYEKFGNDGVQIAFFDDEGNVVAENDLEPEKPEAVSRPVAEDEDTGPSIDTGTGGPAGISEGDSESDPGDTDGVGISVD